jgi:hypothetical protein
MRLPWDLISADSIGHYYNPHIKGKCQRAWSKKRRSRTPGAPVGGRLCASLLRRWLTVVTQRRARGISRPSRSRARFVGTDPLRYQFTISRAIVSGAAYNFTRKHARALSPPARYQEAQRLHDSTSWQTRCGCRQAESQWVFDVVVAEAAIASCAAIRCLKIEMRSQPTLEGHAGRGLAWRFPGVPGNNKPDARRTRKQDACPARRSSIGDVRKLTIGPSRAECGQHRLATRVSLAPWRDNIAPIGACGHSPTLLFRAPLGLSIYRCNWSSSSGR